MPREANELLNYDVVYRSSEDPQHRIDQLVGHNAESLFAEDHTNGWQSERHGAFPQTIILRFAGNVHLEQIRILAHEYKIASSVELRIYQLQDVDVAEPPSYKSVRYTRLGAVDFSRNDQSGYQLRERKTVHLQYDAYFVKLVLESPHQHDMNPYDQVGIYAIECVGQVNRRVAHHAAQDVALLCGLREATSSNGGRRGSATTPKHNNNNNNRRGSRDRRGSKDHGELVASSSGDGGPRRDLPSMTSDDVVGGQAEMMLMQQQQQQQHQHQQQQIMMLMGGTDGGGATTPGTRGGTTRTDDGFPISDASFVPDINFRSVAMMEFEDFFIRRSEELLSLKEQAIAMEDYAVATDCRETLNSMNAQSRRIYQLEQEKVRAIIEEDFGAAEKVKVVMNAMIERVYREATLPEPNNNNNNNNSGDVGGGAFTNMSANGSASIPALPEPPTSSGNYRAAQALPSSPSSGRGAAPRRQAQQQQQQYKGVADDEDVVVEEEEQNPYEDDMYEDNDGDDDGGEHHDDDDDDDVVEDAPTPMVDDKIVLVEEDRAIDLRQLSEGERNAALSILAVAGDAGKGIALTNNGAIARNLVLAVGKFPTACLFSKRFRLREAAINIITDNIADVCLTSVAKAEEAMLSYLNLSSFGVQDSIPNNVFAACTFIRMALADEHQCLASVLTPMANLISRLLSRAADPLPRIRDEVLTTLTLYVQTSAFPISLILHAILTDPIDRERRKVPLSNARAQLPRLQVLQLMLQHRPSSVDGSADIILVSLLIPSLAHPNSDVRDLAALLAATLANTTRIGIKDRELNKIGNPNLRDLLRSRRKSV